MKDGKLVGVVITGRSVSRYLDDGLTLEVNRLCTDGTRNACSFLYGAAARVAKAMGYHKIITYILDTERSLDMATIEKILNDIAKTKDKIAELQKKQRALEAQLAEEENLEIVRMVKAVKMDNKELTAFLKAYASGLITLPENMMPEDGGDQEEPVEMEGYEDEA